MTLAQTPPVAAAARGHHDTGERVRLTPTAGVSLGVAVIWLSVLVLLPLAAVVARGTGHGWNEFWHVVSSRGALDAIRLTVISSLIVAVVNAAMGTLIAWVLVRDRFFGRRLLEIAIDIPFALPTIVAGLVMLTLYGKGGPLGLDLYATRPGVVLALLFVTLPFVVRTVQPVLMALDRDVEEAAASLGAGPLVVFRRVVLPSITPAIASGAALAFGRAMGEYGSVILIAGGLPRTTVASQYVYGQIQDGYLADAASVSTVLLVISIVVLSSLGIFHRRQVRRG
ncbi:MAG: sulfate ABC transporter permease subunit CysT [Actinobacteria bacterium]|nr:sulfate ABC transporter permease subunit CysT [Actinomycetota bacterium]